MDSSRDKITATLQQEFQWSVENELYPRNPNLYITNTEKGDIVGSVLRDVSGITFGRSRGINTTVLQDPVIEDLKFLEGLRNEIANNPNIYAPI